MVREDLQFLVILAVVKVNQILVDTIFNTLVNVDVHKISNNNIDI